MCCIYVCLVVRMGTKDKKKTQFLRVSSDSPSGSAPSETLNYRQFHPACVTLRMFVHFPLHVKYTLTVETIV